MCQHRCLKLQKNWGVYVYLKFFSLALIIGIVVSVPTACSISPARGSAVEPVELDRLSSQGRWFVDERGRVVLIRGGNVGLSAGAKGRKDPPFGPQTAERMSEQGFNGVRLVIFFSQVMPEPGKISEAFLDQLAARISAYHDAGLYVMIDFHQDEYGALVGVRGMPDWAVINGGLDPIPGIEFPLGYFTDPAVQKAFDAFWNNTGVPQTGKGLQDHYADGLMAVAARFANNPAVLGLDVMNEPATGTRCAKPDPAIAHCPELEVEYLEPFYQRASTAIADVAPDLIVFVEPFMLQGALGIPMNTPIVAAKGRRGLSYHNYGPDITARDRVDSYALELATRKEAAIINTEWAFTTDPVAIDSQADDFDRHLISWLAWPRGHFEVIVDPDLSTKGRRNIGNREEILRAYARPYPAATAGTPIKLSFNSSDGVFKYHYSTQLLSGQPATTDLLTEIRIPPAQFPEGYSVTAEGAVVTSIDNSPRLMLRNNMDANEVRVMVTRNGILPPLQNSADDKQILTSLLALPPIPDQILSRHSMLGHILATPGGQDVLYSEMAAGMKGLSHVHGAERLSLIEIQEFAPHYLTDERLSLIEQKLYALEVKPGPVELAVIEHLDTTTSEQPSLDSITADLLANTDARTIIAREAPGLIESKNRSLYPQTTLRNLQPLMPEILTDEVMDSIEAALSKL